MSLYRFLLLLCIASTASACTRNAESPEASASSELKHAEVAASKVDPMPAATGAEAERSRQAAIPADSEQQLLEGIPNKIAMPPKGADTPTIAGGAEVTYVCESGMPLRVAFDGALAHVAWTDGRRLRLSKSANASDSGERYAGEGFVLTRIANVVEFIEQVGGQRWRCAEGAATA